MKESERERAVRETPTMLSLFFYSTGALCARRRFAALMGVDVPRENEEEDMLKEVFRVFDKDGRHSRAQHTHART